MDLVYFFFIEFIKLVFEVDKCIVNIGVVGQGQEGVILFYGWDGVQFSFLIFVILVDKF